VRNDFGLPAPYVAEQPGQHVGKQPAQRIFGQLGHYVAEQLVQRITEQPVQRVSGQPAQRVSEQPIQYAAERPVQHVTEHSVQHVSKQAVWYVAELSVQCVAEQPESPVSEQLAQRISQQSAQYDGEQPAQHVSEQPLAMLLALRVWRDRWRQWRSSVAVRGDIVTMLTMVLHFKGVGASLNIIAREVALEVAASSYRPLIAEHIPGVANVTADVLSRLHVPGSTYELPACLARAASRGPCKASLVVPRAIFPCRPALRQMGLL